MSLAHKDRIEAVKYQVLLKAGGKDATKESLLEILFPEGRDGDFTVYWWDNPWKVNRTFWQRFNILWFTPVFFVFIAPIQWLRKGRVGFDERTKVGRLVLKMIGEK